MWKMKRKHQQPDARETEQFWSKLWQPREHNKKAEWINNIAKELELEEVPKAEYTLIYLEQY